MFDPLSSTVNDHLLRYSFMEGHTQWMGDDKDDDDDDHEEEDADQHKKKRRRKIGMSHTTTVMKKAGKKKYMWMTRIGVGIPR